MPGLRPLPSWTRRARPLVVTLVLAGATVVGGGRPFLAPAAALPPRVAPAQHAASVAPAVPTAPAPVDPPMAYVWPVDAPVVDRFRPPPTPYAAGNRGIDLDTRIGQPVVAAAVGVVVFAGPVGRSLHVVVLHADGLRTTYAFLHRVDVRRGEHVRQGDPIGLAGETLHFGVRVGPAYLDPLALLGRRGPPRLIADPPVRDDAPQRRFRSPWPQPGTGQRALAHRLRRPLRAV